MVYWKGFLHNGLLKRMTCMHIFDFLFHVARWGCHDLGVCVCVCIIQTQEHLICIGKSVSIQIYVHSYI
jgi:hypothetical protein